MLATAERSWCQCLQLLSPFFQKLRKYAVLQSKLHVTPNAAEAVVMTSYTVS